MPYKFVLHVVGALAVLVLVGAACLVLLLVLAIDPVVALPFVCRQADSRKQTC